MSDKKEKRSTNVDELAENLHGGLNCLVDGFKAAATKNREFAMAISLLASKVSDEDMEELGLKRADLDKLKPINSEEKE
jgi:hypothetical protein